MFTESDNTDDMSSAASTATIGSTCTVIELNHSPPPPQPPIVNNQIPNSSCSNGNSINNHQQSHQHKLQPQSESKDTDYYMKLAQAPSSSSGMKNYKTKNTITLRRNNIQGT